MTERGQAGTRLRVESMRIGLRHHHTSRRIVACVVAATALGLAACAGEDRSAGARDRRATAARPADTAPGPGAGAPAATPASARPRVVVLGDSIAAGLGLAREESFPARLQQKIDRAGLAFEVVNAGLSGDTSAGGLRRLDWALDGDVRVLVLELGANDGLRGLPAAEMRRNLSTIVERAKARQVAVLLCGMEAPPNFGASYTSEFRAVYAAVAREHDVPFIPFVLDGVAGLADLNQPDGIHPNPAGARKVADLVWEHLQPMLITAAAS
jgi:acyl-CoA thioesterase I